MLSKKYQTTPPIAISLFEDFDPSSRYSQPPSQSPKIRKQMVNRIKERNNLIRSHPSEESELEKEM
jgi:hypothetical protein